VVEYTQIEAKRETDLHAAQVNSSNLARSMAQQAADAIGEVDSILDGLMERLENGGMSSASEPRMREFLHRRVRFNNQLHGLFIYAADGTWLATSLGAISGNNSDREYFQYHRTHEDTKVHIGPVINSRSTGELVVPVSRRISNADGDFAGILLATVRVEYFRNFYQGFDVDEQGVILLTRNDGTIIVNRSGKDHLIGTSIANNRLFTDLLPHRSTGTATYPSVIDRILRIHSYEQVPGYPLVAIAALSQEAVLASWRREALRSMSMTSVMVLITLALGMALLRQIRQALATSEELQRTHATLEALALQDGLTNLANRRHFDTLLPIETARARRSRKPLAVIMLDIDHFKRYNDHYGHLQGDTCIQQVAMVIRACLRRPADLAARYGGEEFVLLLPETDQAGAWKVADEIVRSVRALRIEHSESSYDFVTLSAGAYAYWPSEQEEELNHCLKQADLALYQAKKMGRNQAQIWVEGFSLGQAE
jgi:diguanylate cyclase (GGDEF)-like protein